MRQEYIRQKEHLKQGLRELKKHGNLLSCLFKKAVSHLEAGTDGDEARAASKSQFTRGHTVYCRKKKKKKTWSLSKSNGEPLRTFRHRSDVVRLIIKGTASGAP